MAPQIIPLTDDEIKAVSDDPAMVAKFTSDERRRLRGLQPQKPPDAVPEGLSVGTLANVATGIVKGAANTVTGLGELAYDYFPGVRMASDAVQRAAFGDVIPGNKMLHSAQQTLLRPQGAAQKVGFAGEQLGEFFIPASKAGALAKVPGITRAIPAAQAALATRAQGGSGTEAAVSAGLSAVLPGASALRKGASALEVGAEKEMAQALGATKEWAKSEAQRLAPQMLQRGVRGSREAMLSDARAAAQKGGQALTDAYKAAAAAGGAVKSDVVRGNIQLARDAFMIADSTGKKVVIPGHEALVGKLDDLDTFVQSLGANIPVDKAATIKRAWDKVISKSGLFGPKATASATDNSSAWALKEASDAFREILNSSPTIEALNKEVGFWTGLKKVLRETEKRTQAQAGTGLVQAGSGIAGAIVGATSGDSYTEKAMGAAFGGLAGRQLVKAIQSPAFRTTITGPLKQKLADALASGSAERIASITGKIVAALPAQFAQ